MANLDGAIDEALIYRVGQELVHLGQCARVRMHCERRTPLMQRARLPRKYSLPNAMLTKHISQCDNLIPGQDRRRRSRSLHALTSKLAISLAACFWVHAPRYCRRGRGGLAGLGRAAPTQPPRVLQPQRCVGQKRSRKKHASTRVSIHVAWCAHEWSQVRAGGGSAPKETGIQVQ